MAGQPAPGGIQSVNPLNIANAAAQKYGIDTTVFAAQIGAESNWKSDAKSPAGAEGIAQFMPGTAQQLGVNPWDVTSSLNGAARLDASNLKKYNGDYRKMLAAYNAGSGAVDSAVSTYGSDWLAYMPSETQNYVNNIEKQANAPNIFQYTANAVTTAIDQGVLNAVNAAVQPLFSALPSYGIHLALFAGAFMIAIIGFWILTRNPAEDSGNVASWGLNKTATGIGKKLGKGYAARKAKREQTHLSHVAAIGSDAAGNADSHKEMKAPKGFTKKEQGAYSKGYKAKVSATKAQIKQSNKINAELKKARPPSIAPPPPDVKVVKP